MFRVQAYNSSTLTCWRLFVGKLHHHCVIDWTVTRLYNGKPEYRRLRLLSWNIYERNRQFSGLPAESR